MKVIVACEFSGIVRDAFRMRGHDAISCDIEPTEYEGPPQYELMIAHPPCTYLAASGNKWMSQPDRVQKQYDAVDFVRYLLDAPVPFIALENPIGALSWFIRKPDQIIQPWQFGHGEVKSTCLWLKNLPKLYPTDIVEGRDPRIHHMGSSKDYVRAMERSRTYVGIADAMAEQWGIE